MKSAIRTIGMLLILASGTSGLMAKEQAENPIKQPVRTEATHKKESAAQSKRVPRKAPSAQQTTPSAMPVYVAPDTKMLGLGCASGAD